MAPLPTSSFRLFTPPAATPTLYPPSSPSTSTVLPSLLPSLDPPALAPVDIPSISGLILEWEDLSHTTLAPSNVRREAFYDTYVLPGVRLWMLLAAGSMLVTTMLVIVCCIIRLRIPRSRREIEILAARRRERMNRIRRKKEKERALHDERSPAIVMNAAVQRYPSMKRPNRTDSKHEKDKKTTRKKAEKS